jgi:hypothetical protein
LKIVYDDRVGMFYCFTEPIVCISPADIKGSSDYRIFTNLVTIFRQLMNVNERQEKNQMVIFFMQQFFEG